ncbi:MAG: PQQ-dependent sugar dehydrogenase, partial [Prolixibacteraceae bacterium]
MKHPKYTVPDKNTAIIFLIILQLPVYFACSQSVSPSANSECTYLESGYGAEGTVEVKSETVVANLEVPWGIAFLPNGDLLVTERPGRLRLVKDYSGNPQLVNKPVANFNTASTSEGGLLGIALHPDFAGNRLFYVYVTVEENGTTNRVEQWRLSDDGTSAEKIKTIYDGIDAARNHNGGRIKFGPDGMLYVGTGDASNPDNSQDLNNPGGKLLRLTPEGEIPEDNPRKGNPLFLSGIRNTQGFAWPDAQDAETVWLTDHGPSGEMLRFGHDEVNVASANDNLGWPTIYKCETEEGMVTPVLTWKNATPPGGAEIYTGDVIPEWKGNLIIGTLGSRHLQRVVIENGKIVTNEVYFQNELGRLREVIMAPDGHLYITTSNCDGRGNCPSDGDKILR